MSARGFLAYWEDLVSKGEAVRVKRHGATTFEYTEKGLEVQRRYSEELKRSGAFKRAAFGTVSAYAETHVDVAIQARRRHLQHGLYSLDEQPEIPGVPPETAESLALLPALDPPVSDPPAPEPPTSKRGHGRAARIILDQPAPTRKHSG